MYLAILIIFSYHSDAEIKIQKWLDYLKETNGVGFLFTDNLSVSQNGNLKVEIVRSLADLIMALESLNFKNDTEILLYYGSDEDENLKMPNYQEHSSVEVRDLMLETLNPIAEILLIDDGINWKLPYQLDKNVRRIMLQNLEHLTERVVLNLSHKETIAFLKNKILDLDQFPGDVYSSYSLTPIMWSWIYPIQHKIFHLLGSSSLVIV